VTHLADTSARAVRAYDPYRYGLVGLALARLLGVPLAVSVHCDYEQCDRLQPGTIPSILGSQETARSVERFVYRQADLVLPIREHIRQVLTPRIEDTDKLQVFPHGVDISAFEAEPTVDVRTEFGIPAGADYVATVGRLDPDHFADDLLTIALQCADRLGGVYFLLCGDGSKREELEQSVRDAGLGDRILLPGMVPHDIVPDVRRQSSAGLSLLDGFSLIEACAGGRPVVAYDVEWHSELVRDGETGYLVPEGDTAAAVERLEYLLTHPDVATSLGEEARRLVFERHSLEAVGRFKSGVYRELVWGSAEADADSGRTADGAAG
jgi:glycosyltransferase involved in cell wall biosynthesis